MWLIACLPRRAHFRQGKYYSVRGGIYSNDCCGYMISPSPNTPCPNRQAPDLPSIPGPQPGIDAALADHDARELQASFQSAYRDDMDALHSDDAHENDVEDNAGLMQLERMKLNTPGKLSPLLKRIHIADESLNSFGKSMGMESE